MITGETFDGCTSASQDGGAIFINSASLNPTIGDSVFLNCSAETGFDGGGFSIIAGTSLVFRCFFGNCRSGMSEPCGWVDSSGLSSLACSETTAIGAIAGFGNTWGFHTASSILTAQFDHGNITGCKAVNWGCGLLFNFVYNAVFEFCEIQFNNGTNCIDISRGSVSSIRCLSLRSNVCTGMSDRMGLVYADAPITVRDSVLAGNTYTYFVHTTSRITFANCYLDSFTLATTGSPITTADCLTGQADARVPGCSATLSLTFPASGTATTPFTRDIRPYLSSRNNRILWFASGLFVLLL
jgi:hypothetical protein